MNFRTWLSDCISKKALLIAFLHWYVTFFIEKSFFSSSTLEKPVVAIAKLLVIVCFWQIVFYMVRRYKTETQYRRYIHFVGAYFTFLMLIMLLIWPGIWFWDDMWLVGQTRYFELKAWQHFLSGTFYYCAAFIFPSPISITILQLACISMIIGYFVNAISDVTKKSKFALLSFLPFIIPPIISQDFLVLRATLFSYLILFFLTSILFKHWQRKNLSTLFVFMLSIVAAIMTTLRGEGLYFVLVAPLLFIYLFWSLSSRKQKFLFISSMYCIIFFITSVQSSILGERDNLRYKLSTYVGPLSSVVLAAKKDNNSDLLKPINEILDISIFDQLSANDAFWSNKLIKEKYYTQEGQKKIKRGFIKLALSYPFDLLNDRAALFQKTKREKPFKDVLQPNQVYSDNYNDAFINGIAANYIDENKRNVILEKLDLNKAPTLNKLFHNIAIPVYLLLVLFFLLLLSRKFLHAVVILSILPLFILVFFSAPYHFFMYYFSVYLAGYAFFIGYLTIIIARFFSKNPLHQNNQIPIK